YPEFTSFTESIFDGTVLDGEIMAFKDGMPLDFQALQKRIGRKIISNKLMEEIPVVFMIYDLLEHEGKDIRQLPMSERRALLEVIVKKAHNENLLISPLVEFKEWIDLDSLIQTAREKRCEGFMLKHKESAYEVGRKKGNWWKWKVDPYSIDAVLTFAMRGHGRRANLYTDYTFGLWQDGELITFAKAYSGLSDKEFNRVDSFVRKNTVQRFGPVRQVKPELVFELAFEGIAHSNRHKSGVAVRFPRMVRWRTDKKASEANKLSDLIDLIPEDGRNQDG
ncbi:MAG: ATP-dependent DNA ligase, partial [Bacteroidetes bacterium]|nr:ATP-dependent DNA ligase [Bacteroidota bacterium]